MATVLIVEDEFLVRNFLQIELEDAGYDVVLAGNADVPIAILEARTDIGPLSMRCGRLRKCSVDM